MKITRMLIINFLIAAALCLSACGDTGNAQIASAVSGPADTAQSGSGPADTAQSVSEPADTAPSGSAGQPTADSNSGQPAADGGSRIKMDVPSGSRPGSRLEDFTFTGFDGESRSLYETLQEKDMVLINIWATWCGPCRMEFPYMEEAYEEYKDRIEIFALSCEPGDTDETLEAFAGELGLTFPMGRDTAGLSNTFRVNAIPTSIVIDRFGTICFIEAGSQTSADNFRRLFSAFLGDDYTESALLTEIPPEPAADAQSKGGIRVYTLSFKDQNDDPVKDVTVNVCDDASCTPMTSNSRGIVRFIQPGFAYHIQVVGVPAGYSYDGGSEVYLDADGGITKFLITKQ